MSVLITGVGLVGSQIARLEVDAGRTPVLFDIAPRLESLKGILDVSRCKVVQGDILSPFDLANVIRKENIERIIHTAANPMLTPGAQTNPYLAIRINIMGTVNILEAARIFGLKRVAFASSATLYDFLAGGDDAGVVGREYAYPRPSTFYASTKLSCENLGMNYADWFGIDFVAVRYAAVFGPWLSGGGGGPTQMMKELIEKSLRGEPVTIPKRYIEYVYSKDAARGTFLACHKDGLKDRIFNVGMGEMHTPEKVVEILRSVAPKANVKFTDTKKLGPDPRQLDKPIDLTRSRAQLGYEPEFTMRKSFEDYIEWYTRTSSRPA